MVLYTKYKGENNALWTIYVKYGLEKYGILKWKMCRNRFNIKRQFIKSLTEITFSRRYEILIFIGYF